MWCSEVEQCSGLVFKSIENEMSCESDIQLPSQKYHFHSHKMFAFFYSPLESSKMILYF